jgi:hypothetical protein
LGGQRLGVQNQARSAKVSLPKAHTDRFVGRLPILYKNSSVI